jgi:hypothetical protein
MAMTLTENEILQQLPALAAALPRERSLADELLAQLPSLARLERASA